MHASAIVALCCSALVSLSVVAPAPYRYDDGVDSLLAKRAGVQKKVCYWGDWTASYLPASAIDVNGCDYILLAFASIDTSSFAPKVSSAMQGQFSGFVALKSKKPTLKLMLSIGGGNAGPTPWRTMLASESNINSFLSKTVQYVKDIKFDGIDIDFEHPESGDKAKFAYFMGKLKGYANSQGLLVSVAVSSAKTYIDNGYDRAKLCSGSDFINLMSYDMWMTWAGKTGHHASLQSSTHQVQSVAYIAQYWANGGCDKSKIMVGVPFYAWTFTLANPSVSGDGAPIDKSNGVQALTYKQVCTKLNSGMTAVPVAGEDVSYYVDGSKWVAFDDPSSIKKKAQWVKNNGYGGVMIWNIGQDDLSNSCGGGKNPMLNAVVSGMS